MPTVLYKERAKERETDRERDRQRERGLYAALRQRGQDSRVAVRFLVVAFVVLHVQGHLTNLAVETSFMPVLETHTHRHTHTHTQRRI